MWEQLDKQLKIDIRTYEKLTSGNISGVVDFRSLQSDLRANTLLVYHEYIMSDD